MTHAASGQSRSERSSGQFPDRFTLEQDGSHPHLVYGLRTAGRNRAKDVIVQIIRLGAGWQSNQDRSRKRANQAATRAACQSKLPYCGMRVGRLHSLVATAVSCYAVVVLQQGAGVALLVAGCRKQPSSRTA
jgi:hypothetical protein